MWHNNGLGNCLLLMFVIDDCNNIYFGDEWTNYDVILWFLLTSGNFSILLIAVLIGTTTKLYLSLIQSFFKLIFQKKVPQHFWPSILFFFCFSFLPYFKSNFVKIFKLYLLWNWIEKRWSLEKKLEFFRFRV